MYSIENEHINIRDKLLIIDDDYSTRLLIKEIMKDTRAKIIETGCGREAQDLFNKFFREIFLVILDIRLPVYDGWTLLDEFKKTDPRVPVIIISAILPLELASRCESEGVLVYLSKPFCIHKFRQIINSYFCI